MRLYLFVTVRRAGCGAPQTNLYAFGMARPALVRLCAPLTVIFEGNVDAVDGHLADQL